MTQRPVPPAVVAVLPPPVPLEDMPEAAKPSVPTVPLANSLALPKPKLKYMSVKNGLWEFVFQSGTVYTTRDPVEAEKLADQYFPPRKYGGNS